MTGAWRTSGLLAVVGLTIVGSARAGAFDCGGPCGEDAGCAGEVAVCLMEADEHTEAVKVLKDARASHPKDERLARLLALAYLGTGNTVWAKKTLLAHLEAVPDDLQSRTWAVWLLLKDGDLDQAQHLLEQAPDPQPGPLAERVELLSVILSQLRDEDEQATQSLEELEKRGEALFPEDIALLGSLRSQVLGKHGEFLSARALLSGGYTTNAVQSAPQDVGTGQEAAGAPVLSLDLVLRLEPWTSPLVRPLAEVRGKGFMPLSKDASGFGYLGLGGRAGGELGRTDGVRVRLLYGYEILGIRDEGWYMTAHRGEFEVDILPELQVFGGAGRRIYAHLPRTRTEMDLGVAVVLPLPGGWNITWLAAARMQFARHKAFDERGVTGLVRVKVPLPLDFMIKLRAMVLLDVFPSSAHYYNQDQDRSDLMLKTEAGVWSPSFHGLRIAATYTLSHRWSTVDSLLDNFNFSDHRFLLQVRWQGSLDPTLPPRAKVGKDHLALPYGLDAGGDTGLDRVQDLLRQEDSARRGSMCVD